jgi:hypothetical protein
MTTSNTETKMTRKQIFEALKAIPANAQYVDFFQHEIEMLDARTEKARAKREEKKAAADELKDKIYAVLTDELQTSADILEKIGANDEEITRGKVTARLTKLVNEGKIERADVKVDKKRVKGYRLIAA